MRANPSIKVATRKEPKKTVEGERIGKHWSIHQNVSSPHRAVSKRWAITHQPSGLAAYMNAPNEKAARIYAETVAKLVELKDPDETARGLIELRILKLHRDLEGETSATGWQKAINAWLKAQGGVKRAKKRALAKAKLAETQRPKKPRKKKAKRGKKLNPEFNPIPGMPGGSVTGCIALQEAKPKAQRPRDSGAYCAAIADRIEPGWRERNPMEQLGLFGEKQTEVEGFALVSPRGRPVEPVRPPKATQERILPAEKPSREAMEELRRRELAERAERRKRKKNPVATLKRRLLTRWT